MVYAVSQRGGGAHEPEAILSIWTTRDLAEAECARLTTTLQPDEGWEYRVIPMPLDTPSDELLN